MLHLKALHKWFTSVALLAAIVSFSGFTNASSNFQKPQTELVYNANGFNDASDFYYSQLFNSSKNQIYNQYTVFNFKCFLINHHLDFSITIKTQKETVLQFNDFNNILQQNLIAQVHSINPHDIL